MKKATRRAPKATRRRLINAAFSEIHQHGFQPTGLDAILARAKLTKGAVYHHFKNKTELGYAVFDEVIVPRVREGWITPVQEADDPIRELIARVKSVPQRPRRELALGCPLNNLIQEASGLEAGFRDRMNEFLDAWRAQLAADLRRGQRDGYVREDVRPTETAAFLVAALEGVVGIAKPASDAKALKQSVGGFVGFLQSLQAD